MGDWEAAGAVDRLASLAPVLGDDMVAIGGRTSRLASKLDTIPLHLVSAFAANAGLVSAQGSARLRKPAPDSGSHRCKVKRSPP